MYVKPMGIETNKKLFFFIIFIYREHNRSTFVKNIYLYSTPYIEEYESVIYQF